MNGIYDYLTESERAEMIENVSLKNEAENIMLEFAICDMKHEAAIRSIDTAALVNNYNEATLVEQYVKEAEEASKAKKSLWQKFKEFVKKIVDKIVGFFTGVTKKDIPDDAEVEISKKELEQAENASKNKGILKKVAKVGGVVAAASALALIGLKVRSKITAVGPDKSKAPKADKTDEKGNIVYDKPAGPAKVDMVKVKASKLKSIMADLSEIAKSVGSDTAKLDENTQDEATIRGTINDLLSFINEKIMNLGKVMIQTGATRDPEMDRLKENQKKLHEINNKLDGNNDKSGRDVNLNASEITWKNKNESVQESFDDLLTLINAI